VRLTLFHPEHYPERRPEAIQKNCRWGTIAGKIISVTNDITGRHRIRTLAQKIPSAEPI